MIGSVCTKCGKPRIAVRTYTEKVESAVVTYTIMECPDPECQKVVNKYLKVEETKRKAIKMDQEQREKERKVNAGRKSIRLGKSSQYSKM